jgi:hypothetical protein
VSLDVRWWSAAAERGATKETGGEHTLWRLTDAHARDTLRSIAGVELVAAAAGLRILVEVRIRVVVVWRIRVIMLVRRRIIGIVGLLVRLLTCVWVVVGHPQRC